MSHNKSQKSPTQSDQNIIQGISCHNSYQHSTFRWVHNGGKVHVRKVVKNDNDDDDGVGGVFLTRITNRKSRKYIFIQKKPQTSASAVAIPRHAYTHKHRLH